MPLLLSIGLAFAGTCVASDGAVNLPCLGVPDLGLALQQHEVGGPGSDAIGLVQARYGALARCLADLPDARGVVVYQLTTDATGTIDRVVRDPESTAEIDACVGAQFLGVPVPGFVGPDRNPVHFTLSFTVLDAPRPPAETLGQMCDVAGSAPTGLALAELATRWAALGPEARQVLAELDLADRAALPGALAAAAARRGVSWQCPALAHVLTGP